MEDGAETNRPMADRPTSKGGRSAPNLTETLLGGSPFYICGGMACLNAVWKLWWARGSSWTRLIHLEDVAMD